MLDVLAGVGTSVSEYTVVTRSESCHRVSRNMSELALIMWPPNTLDLNSMERNEEVESADEVYFV